MDKRIKAKWVKALRSRKYRQIKDRLRDDSHGRCCLGVLADVCAYTLTHPNDENMLPAALCQRVGLDAALNVDRDAPADSQAYLAYLNDYAGRSFAEIADYIEKNL